MSNGLDPDQDQHLPVLIWVTKGESHSSQKLTNWYGDYVKYSAGMENGIKPDQTAPSEVADLSEYLRQIWVC